MYGHSRTFTLLLCCAVCIYMYNMNIQTFGRLKSPNSMSSITDIEQSNNTQQQKQQKKIIIITERKRVSAAHMCSVLHTYVRILTYRPSHNVLLTLFLFNYCFARTRCPIHANTFTFTFTCACR